VLLADELDCAAREWPQESHEDRFFAERVLRALSLGHRRRAAALVASPVSGVEACWELHRLEKRFSVPIMCFERKQYANLSHAANKAMNLNTFIDLIGKRFRAVNRQDGLDLVEAPAGEIRIRSASFILTLDADSVLLPDYVSMLIGVLEAPENARVAVAQTPYASFPDAPSDLERVAGITTDVQRVLHQGFTRFDASFWVGANAVLRMSALQEIREEVEERGYKVARYIRDRTVIEDTESTIDLMVKGWSVWNHLDILAYSATPADFGSLAIQRRRWACGGLIILPKALRHLARVRPHRRLFEAVIRAHYLGSLGWAPLAVLVLLAFPFHPALMTWSLPLAVVPYFISYVWAMRSSGYSPRDLAKVYGLNLLLTPVNLSGAFASLRQAVTGRSVPFQRTPKIGARTAAPPFILAVIWLAPVFLLFSAVNDIILGSFMHAAFAGANGIAVGLAAHHFIGWKQTLEDFGWRTRQEGNTEESAGGLVPTS
jgi:hypothetical protein